MDTLQPIDWSKQAKLSPVYNYNIFSEFGALTSTINDKFIIQKNIPGLVLNAAVTVRCAPDALSAMFQDMPGFLKFFEKTGLPAVGGNCKGLAETCYDAKSCANLPTCQALQASCHSNKVYKVKPNTLKNLTVFNADGTPNPDQTIISIKTALKKGPLFGVINMCPDFWIMPWVNTPGLEGKFDWSTTNNIYIAGAYDEILNKTYPDTKNIFGHSLVESEWGQAILGGYAVEIVGWDVGNAGSTYGNVPYWIIKDCRGTYVSSDNGYFKMAMNIGGKGLNAQCGLDIPVFQPSKKYEGGCVDFEIDKNSGNHILKYIIISAIIIAVIIMAYFLYKKYRRIQK